MTIKLIDQLIDDFELNSTEETLRSLTDIKVSHLKEMASLKPKPRIVKAEPVEQKFKLEITEGTSTFEVVLNSEKELDKFLKDKQKFRKLSLDKWMGQNGVYAPDFDYYRYEEYENKCRVHLALLKAAGLNFEVKIIRC